MAHRVVILGGGFGGLYVAKALGKAPVEVTLVDRQGGKVGGHPCD
ncbi:MAG: FAD-dependent oxidoreductase, partial [Bryobacteraceae bacterium]